MYYLCPWPNRGEVPKREEDCRPSGDGCAFVVVYENEDENENENERETMTYLRYILDNEKNIL